MSVRFCLLPLIGLFLPTLLSAQDGTAAAVARFVSEHNARVASYDWVRTETGAVELTVTAANTIEARVGNHLRIVLERDRPDPMDEVFPRRLSAATVLLTNTTVVIIDAERQLHFVFSLLDEPRTPELTGDPLMIFGGSGLGRHRLETAN